MRIAVLSDIHGNLEAFTSVLAHLDEHEPDVAEIISLGDNVGYGPDPNECIRLLREKNIMSVMGNHELGVARSKYRKWFNSQSREALKRTCELVSEDTVTYIKTLPMFLIRHNCLFVHGLPPDSVLTYLYELDAEQIADLFTQFAESIAFVGHTHELEIIECDAGKVERAPLVQGTYELLPSKRYLLNIGAVGQPRDGNNNAKYVVWDTEDWSVTVYFVPYDIQTTVKKFKERGMPIRYAERLL